MDGLFYIALIKSAKYDFSEIYLNGNNLFIGANGVGKTTLLRAILYFYTADMRMLGIDNNKLSFAEYYFEYENSYIVYLYKKSGKFIIVTVYRENNNIKFRLCLVNKKPNIKEIFIENSKPVELGKLWMKLKQAGGIVSNILNSSEYKKAIYTKIPKLQHYSLFEAKEYSSFVKTIASIFTNSKVDSEAIKKVIVSSLDVDKKVDIEQIKRYLEKFNETYEDIKTYEKNQKKINKIIMLLNKFEQTKNDIQDNFSTLKNSKNILIKEIDILKKENEKILLNIEKQNNLLNEKEQLFAKRSKKLNETIGALKDKIKTSKKKKQYFIQEQIEKKIAKYNSLALLDSQLQNIISQKEFLTSKHKQIEMNHKNIIEQIKNSYKAKELNIEKISDNLEFQKQQTILKLKEERAKELEKIKDKFKIEQDKLKEQDHDIQLQLQELKYNLKEVEKAIFIFDRQELLDKKIKEENQNTKQIKELIAKINNLDNELKNFEINIHKDIQNLSEKKLFEIEKIDDKINKIKKLINPNKKSLLKKIDDNNLNMDKYLYFLNENILNSEIESSILIDDSMRVFELDFNNIDIPINRLSLDLKNFEEEKKLKIREFDKNIQEKKSVFKNFENKIYREKRDCNDNIKRLNIIQSTLQTNIANLKNDLRIGKNIFEEEKNKKIKNLNLKIDEALKQQDLIKDKLSLLDKNRSNQISSKKNLYTKQINQVIKKFNEDIDKNKNLIIELKEFKHNDIEVQKQNYQNILKSKNIDVNKIKEFEQKESKIKETIKIFKRYNKIINEYNYYKKEFFDKQKNFEKEQNIYEQTLSKLTNEYNEISLTLKNILEDLKRNLNNNNISLKNKQNNLEDIKKFEQSLTMKEALKQGIKYIENENYQEINEIITNISGLNVAQNDIRKDIETIVNKISNIFNNSLNIQRGRDTISTAYIIKDFYDNNKIKHFKELLTNSLNQIIKNCSEEYNNLTIYNNKIKQLINKITQLFKQISIGVIDELSIRYSDSNNKVIEILRVIKNLNEQTPAGFGLNLFGNTSNSDDMIKLLKKLRDTIEIDGIKNIYLEDSFVLEFRVVENGNDYKYQTSLHNIGSEGTDILIKNMIYIAMIYIFKDKITKNSISVHVILDEIGKLSQNYLKELIEFANKNSIYFINGAPDPKLVGTYKRVYLVQNINHVSVAQEIVSK